MMAMAPPMILDPGDLLLTSDRRVTGERINSLLVRTLGWVTLRVMSTATVGMLFS
jgi:hypothetical protein